MKPHGSKLAPFGVAALALLGSCVDAPRRPLDPSASEQRLRARTLADPKLRELCVDQLGAPSEPWPPPRFDRSQLVLAAFLFRPDFDVARARLEGAESKTQNAGLWPNPSLTVTGGPVDNHGRASPWIVNVALDFVVQTAGKREKNVAIAEQEVELARLDVAALAWRVYGEVRDAAVALDAAVRAHAHDVAEVDLRTRIVAQLEARVAGGVASRPEVLESQVLLDKAQSAQRKSDAELLAARLRLAAACGVGAGSSELEVEPLAPPAEVHSTATVLDRVDVRHALAEYEAIERELALEVAKQYPDVKLGPGWEYDQGDRKYTLGVGVDLPLFDRNQAGIAAAIAKRGESAAQFEKLQADALAEIESARQLFEAASRSFTSFVGEPEQRSASRAAAARAAFEAGASDQLALLAAELERNEFSRARDEALLSFVNAQSKLEDALQRPLDPKVAALAGSRETIAAARGGTR